MSSALVFEELLGISLSRWESLLVANCLLADRPVEVEAFGDDRANRLSVAAERLRALPSFWSRELCYEVLGAASN